MNKTGINKLIEIMILSLILSYMFIHNIILVFTGMVLSLCLINIDLIQSFFKAKNNNVSQDKDNKNKNNRLLKFKTNSSEKIENKNSTLTLVETIEELGYIPSKEKKEERDIA